jgi:D-alanyl-D-alanine carboxypeptidase
VGEFLEHFPKVKKEQALAVDEIAGKIMTSKNIEQLYETAA